MSFSGKIEVPVSVSNNMQYGIPLQEKTIEENSESVRKVVRVVRLPVSLYNENGDLSPIAINSINTPGIDDEESSRFLQNFRLKVGDTLPVINGKGGVSPVPIGEELLPRRLKKEISFSSLSFPVLERPDSTPNLNSRSDSCNTSRTVSRLKKSVDDSDRLRQSIESIEVAFELNQRNLSELEKIEDLLKDLSSDFDDLGDEELSNRYNNISKRIGLLVHFRRSLQDLKLDEKWNKIFENGTDLKLLRDLELECEKLRDDAKLQTVDSIEKEIHVFLKVLNQARDDFFTQKKRELTRKYPYIDLTKTKEAFDEYRNLREKAIGSGQDDVVTWCDSKTEQQKKYQLKFFLDAKKSIEKSSSYSDLFDLLKEINNENSRVFYEEDINNQNSLVSDKKESIKTVLDELESLLIEKLRDPEIIKAWIKENTPKNIQKTIREGLFVCDFSKMRELAAKVLEKYPDVLSSWLDAIKKTEEELLYREMIYGNKWIVFIEQHLIKMEEKIKEAEQSQNREEFFDQIKDYFSLIKRSINCFEEKELKNFHGLNPVFLKEAVNVLNATCDALFEYFKSVYSFSEDFYYSTDQNVN